MQGKTATGRKLHFFIFGKHFVLFGHCFVRGRSIVDVFLGISTGDGGDFGIDDGEIGGGSERVTGQQVASMDHHSTPLDHD